jgi:hypothetical protein
VIALLRLGDGRESDAITASCGRQLSEGYSSGGGSEKDDLRAWLPVFDWPDCQHQARSTTPTACPPRSFRIVFSSYSHLKPRNFIGATAVQL